jgi:hypothetical protein
MTRTLTNPREEVAEGAGEGGYGNDFSPADRDLEAARMKSRAVLEGRDHFTFNELEKIVARLIARG